MRGEGEVTRSQPMSRLQLYTGAPKKLWRSNSISNQELEFVKSLWGLGTEEEEGYRTGPPGYTGGRNSFLEIDSGAPYTFKNTGSGL